VSIPPFFGLAKKFRRSSDLPKSSTVLWIGQKDTPLSHKGIEVSIAVTNFGFATFFV